MCKAAYHQSRIPACMRSCAAKVVRSHIAHTSMKSCMVYRVWVRPLFCRFRQTASRVGHQRFRLGSSWRTEESRTSRLPCLREGCKSSSTNSSGSQPCKKGRGKRRGGGGERKGQGGTGLLSEFFNSIHSVYTSCETPHRPHVSKTGPCSGCKPKATS